MHLPHVDLNQGQCLTFVHSPCVVEPNWQLHPSEPTSFGSGDITMHLVINTEVLQLEYTLFPSYFYSFLQSLFNMKEYWISRGKIVACHHETQESKLSICLSCIHCGFIPELEMSGTMSVCFCKDDYVWQVFLGQLSQFRHPFPDIYEKTLQTWLGWEQLYLLPGALTNFVPCCDILILANMCGLSAIS